MSHQISIAINNAQQAEALTQSEERYRILFDQSPVGVYLFDTDLKITNCNQRMVQMLQSSRDKIIGLDMRKLKCKSFVPAMERTIQGQSSYHEDFYEATTSSAKLWLSQYFSPLLDSKGNVVGSMGVAENITERRQAEEDREHLLNELRAKHEQLQLLSRRLVEIQESERTHIARELHDEIGQLLTGLKFEIEAIRRLPSDAVKDKLRGMEMTVNELLGRVRDISLDLRPAMLDDIGLLHALLWHFDRYTSQTGISVDFKQAEMKRLPREVETAIYRIVQEALTNVARHAGVSEAAVRLRLAQDTLNLEVKDKGTGFDPETVLTEGRTCGLIGIRERVKLLGGKFIIDSARVAGTCLKVELPIEIGQ